MDDAIYTEELPTSSLHSWKYSGACTDLEVRKKAGKKRNEELVDVAAAPPGPFYTDTKLIFSHRKRLSESSRSSPRRPGRTDLFPNGSV